MLLKIMWLLNILLTQLFNLNDTSKKPASYVQLSSAVNATTERPIETSCIAYGGVNATCKTLEECPMLQQLLEKKHKTAHDVNMLNTTQCGHTKVCCPNPCYTPDGKEGSCKSILFCPSLGKLLEGNVSDSTLQYVQDFRCKHSDEYSVCCPLENSNLVMQKDGNCAATMSDLPPDPRTNCCGVDNIIGNKIIGGVPTKIDEYPWLVLIEYLKNDKVKILCGGALISGRYILTAAHCVTGRILEEGLPVTVRLGEYDTEQEGQDCVQVEGRGTDCTDGMITIPIERIIPHPEYRAPVKHKLNDIALIKLLTSAPYTAFIRPICLPSEDWTASAPGRLVNLPVAGWGITSHNNSSKPSNLKLQVALNFVGRDSCNPVFNSLDIHIDSRSLFCAGGVPGKDACMGDSGGPLMFENGPQYEAIGIVSFGLTPCGLQVPGLYTRVYEYLPWIRKTIEEFK